MNVVEQISYIFLRVYVSTSSFEMLTTMHKTTVPETHNWSFNGQVYRFLYWGETLVIEM